MHPQSSVEYPIQGVKPGGLEKVTLASNKTATCSDAKTWCRANKCQISISVVRDVICIRGAGVNPHLFDQEDAQARPFQPARHHA